MTFSRMQREELIRADALLGGQWAPEHGGRRFTVSNPADGSVLAEVADCGAIEAAVAVDRAAAAFAEWKQRPAQDRALCMKRWHARVLAEAEDLARLISLEQGKPLRESRAEIAYGAGYIEWFAEEARRIYGETIPSPAPGRQIVVQKEPVGIVAAVTPWNFPMAMLARKLAPALAAGCTVVAKPAEDTPLSALALAYLAEEAGIPAGVLNIVPASRGRAAEVVDAWLDDARVRKLSFTGSTAVGRKLAARSAATVKRVSLELGGNAPFIVFADADLDAAVAGVIAAKFRNSGQTCIAANRILVQQSIHDAFVARLTAAVQKLRVGPSLADDANDQGPLINARALRKVEHYLADACARGAKLCLGGVVDPAGSLFFAPTILVDVRPEMLIAQEEIFGPVAALQSFDSEQDAVSLANDSAYGLVAYFYSKDLDRIWRVANALQVGMIGINAGMISTEVAPFGGVKQSGYGREGSRYGIDDYISLKYIALGGLG